MNTTAKPSRRPSHRHGDTNQARQSNHLVFDRPLIRERLRRAARIQPHVDFLLQHIAGDFASRLALIQRTFPLALNLGAYNGLLSRELEGIAGIKTIIDLEDVPELVELCRSPRILADEETLPIAPASLDLIVSGLKLQLANDLPGILLQARQALRPDGLFMGAILGPDTLKELRAAFFAAEEEILGGTSPRVAPFVDVRQAGSLLQRAGFALPVADADLITVTYQSPLQLMHDLKAMGATNPIADRLRTPMVRGLLFRAMEIYSDRYAVEGDRIEATFEIITMTGWAPHESQQKPLRPGSAQVSLAEVLKPAPPSPADD